MYYAHSVREQPRETWDPLPTHALAVAATAERFATGFGMGPWAWLAGLLHDLGKASSGFQRRLEGGPKVDHASAGAIEAMSHCNSTMGSLLAYTIAGHHSGLANAANLRSRLDDASRTYHSDTLLSLLSSAPSPGMAFLQPDPPDWANTPFGRAFLTRMLFSCLVDADHLETERFFDPAKAGRRNDTATVTRTHLDALSRHLDALADRAQGKPLTALRQTVLSACRTKASLPPGFFSLHVPTGGGKTLASLAFALSHACHHGLNRVVTIIPYTSIIEQNAAIYRSVLGDAVLEHHSGFRAEQDTGQIEWEDRDKRWLAEDNWDSPVIVTTTVQFFESLYANRPMPCRKLHNLVGSVLVLDEAQTMPAPLLGPCLAALRELVDHYGCSVVFCTATLPALKQSDWLPVGIPQEQIRPIIDTPDAFHQALRRVTLTVLPEPIDDTVLADRLLSHSRVLCIVNRRAHARTLFDHLAETDGAFHLSARMCPAHRRDVLKQIHARLAAGQPCRVIATSVVECGVDVDFPVVYRALNGLDSLIQAAGRCNREGAPTPGTFVVFTPVKDRPFGEEQRRTAITRTLLHSAPDPFAPAAVTSYFQQHYAFYAPDRCDTNNVLKGPLEHACHRRGPKINFADMAERFRMIEQDENALSILIPYDAEGQAALSELETCETVSKSLLRRLQGYSLTLYRSERSALPPGALRTVKGRFLILDGAYDQRTGVMAPPLPLGKDTLIG